MKTVIMQAQVSNQPPYAEALTSNGPLLMHTHPEHVAAHWVANFTYQLLKPTGFVHNKVTFTLITHEGSQVHSMFQYFDEECAEDLAKFWIPVVTKYISED
jgi:hypothetical protein